MQLFDQPANWSASHTMVIPLGVNADPDRVDQIMQFLAWMNDQNFVWSHTGHFPVNQSDFESEEYLALPHRTEYIDLGVQSFNMPRGTWVTALDPIMNEAIGAAVTGIMTAEEALENAQARLDDLVAFGN